MVEEKEKTQKGKVLVHTSKGIFPYDMLKDAEIKNGSKQLEETLKWMSANDLIAPPYPPNALLVLYESNPIFWRCVNQLAIDVAGLGWKLQVREGKKENEKELVRLREFLDCPNSDDSFRSILKKLLIDWGAIGWFGIEVLRNRKGDVGEIYHVPAHTLRVHSKKKKYAQSRNNKRVWFKKFGEVKDISAKEGKQRKSLGKDRANEMIFYLNYYPKSGYYGAPNIISAVGDVIGLIGLRDYNLAFFENFGIPAGLIVLEGEWEDGSDGKVRDFLNKEMKGSDNAHRTMVITQPKDCKFKYEKLSVDVKEASFKLYEQARRDDILIAYSMPPERIGIRMVGKLGGNVAKEATQTYVQGVVEPLQLDLEEIVNGKLLQSEIYELKFNNVDLRDLDKLIERLIKEVQTAIKTPNEARNELGLKPYPMGDRFFVGSSLVEAGEVELEDKFAKENLLADTFEQDKAYKNRENDD